MAEKQTPEAAEEKKKEDAPQKEPNKKPKELEKKEDPKPASEKVQEEVSRSVHDFMYETVRGPLGKLLLAGAILASPVVAGGVWAIDKGAQKIPVVNKLYEKPRALVKDGVTKTIDLSLGTATFPAHAVDSAINFGQGLTGNVKNESKGFFGKIFEHPLQKTGSALKWGLEKGINFTKATAETLKNASEAILKLASIPFSFSYNASNSALSLIPGVRNFASPISYVASIAGGLGIGYGVATLMGPTTLAAYEGFLGTAWEWVKTMFYTIRS